ncbi:MAG: hypothetical protein ACYCT7_06795 [bacterium]
MAVNDNARKDKGKGDIKMKKEHIVMIIIGALVGHIILSNISPKYRKFTEDVMLGVSAMNLLKLAV